MKSLLSLLAFLVALTALAMPLKWDCNFPEAAAKTFSVYQGETVTFEPTFRVNGKTVDLDIEGIYYQTNGMADSWWKLDDNTFTPTNDVGAAAYRFFVLAAGAGGKNYRANGTLRMLPSPGFVPNAIKVPIKTLKVYDHLLGITWKQEMYNGNLYYIAVTNANITEVK